MARVMAPMGEGGLLRSSLGRPYRRRSNARQAIASKAPPGRFHVPRQSLLLGVGSPITIVRSSFEEVAPDRCARAGDQDVALLEDDVPGERVRDGKFAPDLPAVPRALALMKKL